MCLEVLEIKFAFSRRLLRLLRISPIMSVMSSTLNFVSVYFKIVALVLLFSDECVSWCVTYVR